MGRREGRGERQQPMTGGTGHDLFSLLKLDFTDKNDIDFALVVDKKSETVYH
jgi:hypothetical protein